MYEIVALKTVVLRLFSSETPPEEAQKMQYELTAQGHSCQVIEQPDPAFPPGDIVIVLSDAYQTGSHGFGVLIRKHALRMGGPRPVPFR